MKAGKIKPDCVSPHTSAHTVLILLASGGQVTAKLPNPTIKTKLVVVANWKTPCLYCDTKLHFSCTMEIQSKYRQAFLMQTNGLDLE